MITKPILIKFLISAVSVMMMLATTSSGTAYADVEPGIDLSEMTQAGFPGFENTVKLKVKKKGSKGFKLIVKGKGRRGDYLNLPPLDSLEIKNYRYKLVAVFDPRGNFVDGTLKIKGKLNTPLGKAKGTLMTASLGSILPETDFAYISHVDLAHFTDQAVIHFYGSLLGFNTHDIVCNPVIDELVGGCASSEFVYILLEESGFSPTVKNFKSRGLSVTTFPAIE
ncbi:MAG: hypothetical protein OEV12_11020 [Gammaproteobacteria bacterium]|nr:hypothetical protein [Gammaproteobacteria bacterium]